MRHWNIPKMECQRRSNQGWRSSFHSAGGSSALV